jgi:nucleotide-binding universal stress UspA family protein
VKLQHIVVATDGSDTGQGACRVAMDLARRASARVTVLRAVAGRRVPVGAWRDSSEAELAHLRAGMVAAPAADGVPVKYDVEFGHPSVEIPRFAETHAADLIVIGRTPRTQATRFRVGDTADALMRRSRVPCLMVPPDSPPIRRVLAAVDGSPRGSKVLAAASDFARDVGAILRAVMVEPAAPADEAPGPVAPGARAARLQATLGPALRVRRGPIFEQVLAELHDGGSDLLVVGMHRGGPPGVLELGSVGRHLAHAAPCAALTIPL